MVRPACQDSYQLSGATIGSLVRCICTGSGVERGEIYKIRRIKDDMFGSNPRYFFSVSDPANIYPHATVFQWRFELAETPKCIYCKAPTESYKDKTVCTECYRIQEE